MQCIKTNPIQNSIILPALSSVLVNKYLPKDHSGWVSVVYMYSLYCFFFTLKTIPYICHSKILLIDIWEEKFHSNLYMYDNYYLEGLYKSAETPAPSVYEPIVS